MLREMSVEEERYWQSTKKFLEVLGFPTQNGNVEEIRYCLEQANRHFLNGNPLTEEQKHIILLEVP